MFAGASFRLKRSELLGQSRQFIVVNYVFFAISRLLLLFFLDLVEERPELLGECGELVIVNDALLFARLEILKCLDLVLRQILPILLAKSTKFIIIKCIIFRFLLFNGTLSGEFDPSDDRSRPLDMPNQRKSFGR